MENQKNIPTEYQKKFEDTLTFDQVTTILKLYPEIYHRLIDDIAIITNLLTQQNPNEGFDWETSMKGSLDSTYSSKTNQSFERLELIFTNNQIDEINVSVNESTFIETMEKNVLKNVKNILNNKNDENL